MRATRAKTSSKSIPSYCTNPRATSLVLCLTISPASFRFSLYTHFRVIATMTPEAGLLASRFDSA
jgi:hypothetical protein